MSKNKNLKVRFLKLAAMIIIYSFAMGITIRIGRSL